MLPTFKLRDGRQVKLGRIIPRVRPQALRFAAYLDSRKVTPPPAKVDYATKAMESIKRIYLNDQYGDCVIASAYHQEGLWSANETGTAVLGTDNEVYQSYQTICGPGDNGCDISEVLNYTRDRGLPFNGVNKKIDGYVSVDNTNKLEVQVAIYLLGSLKLGIDLPNDWTCTDCTWDTTNSGIVGGHDVPCVGYDDKGVQIATWGGIVTITWAAFTSSKWITECYATLAPDWYSKNNLAPNGIDVATLKDDLAKLGGGVIPDPGPTPPIVCPPGQHFDPVLNQCVPNGPIPPPTPGVVHIPAQTVSGTIFGIPLVNVSIPAMTIPVTQGSLAAITIPPWLLWILRQACAAAPALPPPWNIIAQVVCGLLPSGSGNVIMHGNTITGSLNYGINPCGGCK